MEHYVEALLILFGAPKALITSTVVTVIIGGLAYSAYTGAKDSADRKGSAISNEGYFWISIFLAFATLSLAWTAIKALLQILG